MQSAPLVSCTEYRPSSSDWFELFCDQSFAIWLDSAQSQYGRWDILSAEPHKWLDTISKTTRICSLAKSSHRRAMQIGELGSRHLEISLAR